MRSLASLDTGDTERLRAILNGLTRKHPELSALVARLPADLSVTPDFVSAYRASSIPYGRRSLVLRVLLGENLSGRLQDDTPISRALLTRLVAWLQANDALSGTYAARELVPKAIATRLGGSRVSVANFIRRMAIEPLDQLDRTGTTAFAAYTGLAAEDLDPLRAFAAARQLSRVEADRLTAPDAPRLPNEGTWWFDTGSASLDLRNALVYLASLLARDRDGGRIQNRLPKTLTDRWQLPRVSIPHALAFCDVAALAKEGLIPFAPGTTDPCGLAGPMGDLAASRQRQQDHDLDRAYEEHRARWRVSQEVVLQREQLRERKARGGQFDSSFLFNAVRLLTTRAPLAEFAPYYAQLDADRMLASHADTWGSCGLPIAARLQAWREQGEVEEAGALRALRLRDLGNILAWLGHLGITDAREASAQLPSVARMALGEAAPQATGQGRPHRGRATAAPAARLKSLPMLEAMWSLPLRARLIEPGAPMPSPGVVPTFVPAALAAGRHVPPHIQVIGDERINWNDDPMALATQQLEQLGYRVERLSAAKIPPL